MGSSKPAVTLASLVLVGTGIVACGSVKSISGPADCDGSGICKIDIDVDGRCVPTAQPDPTYVDKRSGQVPVRWTAPSGYSFSANGIQFKNPGTPIDRRPGRAPSGKTWMVVDTPDPLASGSVSFTYRIELIRDSDGHSCPGPDPVITNR